MLIKVYSDGEIYYIDEEEFYNPFPDPKPEPPEPVPPTPDPVPTPEDWSQKLHAL